MPAQASALPAVVPSALPAALPITVIALCFNHSAFLHECLDSIAAQTFQDFQLIVTDDGSRDASPALIEAWLAQHRPDAQFIRHTANRGLCATLNEALALARGQFIAMVATDDRWHLNRLQEHVDALANGSAGADVLYSDARVIDEAGNPLEPSFIAMHRPAARPLADDLFAALAQGNFIPAMCTSIRTAALRAVGGYDEALTYEDYDMWLRLAAARHRFAHVPATLADYRIVGTSLARTLFVQPTARHYQSLLLIHAKWIDSALLGAPLRRAWADRMAAAAYGLFMLDDARARRWLLPAGWRARNPRLVGLGLCARLGLTRSRLKRWLP